ncbi:MAG: cupin domain-containing protein [Candidatus Zipacnadales bacterium]
MKKRNASDVEALTVEEGAQGVQIQWLLDEMTGAPHFSMRRFEIAAGGYTPFHQHPWEHEVYILSGRGFVRTEQADYPLQSNDAILVEPQEKHQFRAADDEPLVLLCLVPNGPATAR